jgi:hypothetical protein
VIVSVLLELLEGFIAGVIAGEDLGEEQAQSNPRCIDPVSPEMVAATAGRLDG